MRGAQISCAAGALVDWLLEGPAWLERLVRRDLLGGNPSDPTMERLRRRGLADPPVAEWLALLDGWPGPPVKSHKTLALLYHKLDFLADIGLDRSDPESAGVADAILKAASPEGPFRLPILLPKAFGGSGAVEETWILTDAPVLIGILAKMGSADHPKVTAAAAHVAGLVRDNGWPCAAAPELGRFKGPGRKNDPCPYATLVSLRMIADAGLDADGEAARRGVASLLDFWELRGERKYYMFGIGTDFMKLKAPFVWFDVLHVLDVLSRFPAAVRDPRFLDMLSRAEAMADADGRYTPASVYRPAAGFDFGGKKEPSRWITFLMARIRARA